MDNLTHSLIGAVLGQAGLKRKTGLAMPTLIIAANLPDVDATCTVFGTLSLAMRRGITHGPIAMVLLPLVLTGAMIAWDKRQTRRGTRPVDRPPVRAGWLVALAYIGCLSHPLFDWMNSYGVRLLEPFSHRWFYGDALFIIDPWLLAMLIAGVWFSRKREKAEVLDGSDPATYAITGIVAYLALNIGTSLWLAREARMSEPYAEVAVANPVPLAFWRREVLWRSGGQYGSYTATLWSRGPAARSLPIGMNDSEIAPRVGKSKDARAFLFWSRMPIAKRDGDAIVLGDQRFDGSITASNFTVRLEP